MTITSSNAFTVDDLEAMPDDGKRYELIGGAIVMTPAPEPVHQRVGLNLVRLIQDVCPPGHEVFVSPIDFDLPGGQRVDPARSHLLALRLVDGAYEPYADTTGPATLDWPVPVSFSVADLARPRAR